MEAPISSSVRARVCVYQHATDAMAATTAETGPTNSTAVSRAQISLDLRVIVNGKQACRQGGALGAYAPPSK